MIDSLVVMSYFGVMLFVGWRSRKQSAEAYWVADRRYGTASVSVSLIATIFGASSTLGIIGLGYSQGLTGAWWSLIGAIALVPFGLLLAGRVRSLAVYTLPDILRHAYGERVAVPAALMITIAWIGVIAAQMIAGARLLSAVLPIDYSWAITLVAVIFVAYTFVGGQLSVIRTDSFQLLLFAVALLGCLVALLGMMDPDGTSRWTDLPEQHTRFPISETFGWYDVLVFYPLIVGLPYLVGPDIYSRMLCARDNRTARRSALLAAGFLVPISFLLAITGLLIRARFPELEADSALPIALDWLLPVGLKGLIAAGFLAAVMSSADTTLMSASTIVSLNIVNPLRPMSQSSQLAVTKLVLLVIGAAAWLTAGFREGIIPSLLLGYTVFVGGVVFPTLASFYRDRLGITDNGAMWAVIVGGTTAILGEIRQGEALKSLIGSHGDGLLMQLLGPRYPSILPVILSVLTMIVVSRITRAQSPRAGASASAGRGG